jgi:hypothetical protein
VEENASNSTDDSESYYPVLDQVDFAILVNEWRGVALFEDDVFLIMQGSNLGITDATITPWEYDVLRDLVAEERTAFSCVPLNAFSQMWIFAAYELMRLWRERLRNLSKWEKCGGLNQAIANLAQTEDSNVSARMRKHQIERYRDDATFRHRSEAEWARFEPVFNCLDLLRINLAKHVNAGKNTIASAPGYARIHPECGSMCYEIRDKEGYDHSRLKQYH